MKDQILGSFIVGIWIAFIMFLMFTSNIIITKIIAVSFVSWELFKLIHDSLKE